MHVTRRWMLAASGLSLGLAGCVGSEDPDDGTPDDPETVTPDDETPADEDDDVTVDETVVVGPAGAHRFDPETLSVDVGDAVEFVWDSGGHNIVVRDSPAGAEWDGVSGLQSAGFTHHHTFSAAGRYEYVCGPHEGAGMTGEIVVGSGSDDGESTGESDENGADDGTGNGDSADDEDDYYRAE